MDIVHGTLAVIAGHSVKRRLYNILRREFHLLHMAKEAYTTVANCKSCAAQGMRNCHQKKLRLVTAGGWLDFAAMDMMRLLPRIKSGIYTKFSSQTVI